MTVAESTHLFVGQVRPLAGDLGKQTRELAESLGIRVWNLLAGATDEVQIPVSVPLEFDDQD